MRVRGVGAWAGGGCGLRALGLGGFGPPAWAGGCGPGARRAGSQGWGVWRGLGWGLWGSAGAGDTVREVGDVLLPGAGWLTALLALLG